MAEFEPSVPSWRRPRHIRWAREMRDGDDAAPDAGEDVELEIHDAGDLIWASVRYC
jgi:hypothetical protein